MDIREINELKERLLSCIDGYPIILEDGSRDTDIDRIVAAIGNWYREEVRRKLPVSGKMIW